MKRKIDTYGTNTKKETIYLWSSTQYKNIREAMLAAAYYIGRIQTDKSIVHDSKLDTIDPLSIRCFYDERE